MSEEQNKHFLLPGALFVQPGEHLVTTVLGSCVSVCLWDKNLNIGGMNHHKLPLWNGDGLASPKFGNIALQKMLEKLIQLGSQPKMLQAKVFGGAAVLKGASGLLNVGERNIDVAREFLQKNRIPVTGADVGGEASRKVIFNTSTGKVLMKKAKAQ